jgi:hypothetical protein
MRKVKKAGEAGEAGEVKSNIIKKFMELSN